MPPHLKKSINQAYFENGTYDQIVKHLEREMELNGLEADEPLVKTQMTVTKKAENTEKPNKKQNDKAKKQTPKTVPDKTLKNDQCRYCKEGGHMMTDCPKLAKRRKLEEDPIAEKCHNCKTPGHDEENCYFGANMENRPPKWTLTEAQKKVIEKYKQAKKTHQTKNGTTPTILVEGFKLESPRLYTNSPQKQNLEDDWQHQLSPKPATTAVCETQLTTQNSQQSRLETQHDDLYKLLHNAPDNYFLQQTNNPETESNSEIQHTTKHHVTIKTSCNDKKQPLLNEDLTEHIQFDKERNLSYHPISTSLTLKRKRHMYYIPMDFEKLTFDGLIDTGALTSAISEQDLNKIKLLANEAIKETGPLPNFQIMVANGQLEVPIGTVLLEFEVADFMLKENFIIMKNLPNPLIGLCFLRRNNAIFDVNQGILTFPYLSMQLKPDTQTAIRQATPLFAENTYTLQPGEILAVASKMPHLMDNNATGIVTPSQQFENHDSIVITASLSTVNNNAIGYQIINFSDLPYTSTLDTYSADFKILTPEQIKHI